MKSKKDLISDLITDFWKEQSPDRPLPHPSLLDDKLKPDSLRLPLPTSILRIE